VAPPSVTAEDGWAAPDRPNCTQARNSARLRTALSCKAFSCSGRQVPAQGVIAIVKGLLPTFIGWPRLLVAVAIGVTEPEP